MMSHDSDRLSVFLFILFSFFLLWLNNFKWHLQVHWFFLLPEQVCCWSSLLHFFIAVIAVFSSKIFLASFLCYLFVRLLILCLYCPDFVKIVICFLSYVSEFFKTIFFTLLIVSFVVQKLLSFIRSHLFIFAFISNILGSISSKGFLPTVVYIMIIWVKSAHSSPL